MPARAWGVEHLSALERAQKIIEAGVRPVRRRGAPELRRRAGPLRAGQPRRGSTSRSAGCCGRSSCSGCSTTRFLDPEHAVATIGRTDFVAAGEAAQRAAIVRLTAAESGPAALPLAAGRRGLRRGHRFDHAATRLGTVVGDPADADLAVLRLNAPYEPRPGGFESFFHAGSLEFPAAERDRIVAICEQVPTIIALFLDRPAVVPEIADAAAALLVDFGARDDAVIDVLLGQAQARGPATLRPPVLDAGRRGQPQRRPVRHSRPAVSVRRRHHRLYRMTDRTRTRPALARVPLS